MDKKLSFEEALEELESISEKIENENTSLEESIKLYERGIELSKICADTLKTAKQKIISLESAESEEQND